MGRNGSVLPIHTDHLGTPRLMTDEQARPVWQWPYSGFGEIEPSGVLQPQVVTTTPGRNNSGRAAAALKATAPQQRLDLRFPGQVRDGVMGVNHNFQRIYGLKENRYTQLDRIGLAGGMNPYLYADANPLSFTDELGLAPDGHHWVIGPIRNDPNLSPDARQVFRDAKTGYYGERHGWDKAHSEYNKGVQDLWNSKKFDLPNMSKAQAQEFVRDVMRSADPRVADYRRQIINQCLNYGMRRSSWTRGGQE